MAVAVFMFACGGPQQKTETVEVDALSISALMENVDQYVGDTVTVKGTVDTYVVTVATKCFWFAQRQIKN